MASEEEAECALFSLVPFRRGQALAAAMAGVSVSPCGCGMYCAYAKPAELSAKVALRGGVADEAS